jgi:tetratricopeptide (TPR) repeat protein
MSRSYLSLVAGVLALGLSACEPDSPKPATAPLSFDAVDPLLKQRDIPAAEKALNAMLAEHGPEVGIVTRLARVLQADGRGSEAIAILRKGSQAHPESGAIWYELGLLYDQVEQYALAKDALLEARAKGVKDKHISLLLGSLLARLGDPDAAALEFDRALAAGDDEITVRYNQGLVQFQRKDYQGARTVLEALLAKHPEHAESKRELARVLMALAPTDPTQVERAGALLWDVKDKFAEDTHTWELMGDYWLLKQDYEAAVASYTEALRFGQNPPHVEGKYRVAEQARRDAQAKNNPK